MGNGKTSLKLLEIKNRIVLSLMTLPPTNVVQFTYLTSIKYSERSMCTFHTKNKIIS